MTDTSLIIPEELTEELSGSVIAAIVVCTLIGFLAIAVAVVILLLLWRRRRQRQKEAEAAAKQTVVGPATKPAQPTHNGTWTGSFGGLWKNQTWRGAPEDDELPLRDRLDGNRFLLLVSQLFSRTELDRIRLCITPRRYGITLLTLYYNVFKQYNRLTLSIFLASVAVMTTAWTR